MLLHAVESTTMAAGPGGATVQILRWPAEAHRRDPGGPCLWLLGVGELPPEIGPLEDWAGLPIDDRDLHARVLRLVARANGAGGLLPGEVQVEGDGSVRRAGVVSYFPLVEAAILDRLGATPDQVVSRSDLAEAVWGDCSRTGRGLDSRIHVLRQRIEPLGLVIHTIRGRGFLLTTEVGAACRPVAPRTGRRCPPQR